MFINKSKRGENNICGRNIASLRKKAGVSQNGLASLLQIHGLNLDKNAVQRIEAGKRFVTDIELVYISDVLGVTFYELIDRSQLNVACANEFPHD